MRVDQTVKRLHQKSEEDQAFKLFRTELINRKGHNKEQGIQSIERGFGRPSLTPGRVLKERISFIIHSFFQVKIKKRIFFEKCSFPEVSAILNLENNVEKRMREIRRIYENIKVANKQKRKWISKNKVSKKRTVNLKRTRELKLS